MRPVQSREKRLMGHWQHWAAIPAKLSLDEWSSIMFRKTILGWSLMALAALGMTLVTPTAAHARRRCNGRHWYAGRTYVTTAPAGVATPVPAGTAPANPDGTTAPQPAPAAPENTPEPPPSPVN
jgi:hypothetical protein